MHFAPDGTIEERDFLTGFLVDDVAIGRPAEVAEGPDGSVFISDDFAGAVYQVQPGGGSRATSIAAGAPNQPGRTYDRATVGAVEREAAVAAGPATFTNEGCDVCHGDSATPDTTQIELAGLGMRYTVEELAEYLGTPQAPMPPYEADANARRALAIYLLETY